MYIWKYCKTSVCLNNYSCTVWVLPVKQNKELECVLMSFNVFIVWFWCLKFLWTDLQFICEINNRLRPLELSASLFPLQNQNKRLNTLKSFMFAVRLRNGSQPEPDVTAVNCFSPTVLCTICDDRLLATVCFIVFYCSYLFLLCLGQDPDCFTHTA